jgi:hypothetical protein
LDDADRLVAVLLVDAHRQAWADLKLLQKQHNLFDLLLFLPSADNALDTLGAKPWHFAQPMRLVIDHVQRVDAECLGDALGGDWANTFDQPRAEVTPNAFDGGGQQIAVALDLELAAMLGVIDPAPFEFERFADLDANEFADHRYRVVFAMRCDTGHGIAVLLVLKGDAFEGCFECGHSAARCRRGAYLFDNDAFSIAFQPPCSQRFWHLGVTR